MSFLHNRGSMSATIICLLVVFGCATLTTDAAAADYDKPVFDFQHKLAVKGNAKAQYFLAQMYEQGRGTLANAELARHWYELARRNGYVHEEQMVSAN